jgi:protein-S-isoprenylcysteine O-methyltransferase Ste14
MIVRTTASQQESSPSPDTPGVIAPPPLIYLGALGSGFALQALLPGTPVAGAVRWPVGAALILGGGALARSFFREFAHAGTPISPYSKPTTLVTSGPYRLTRNPAYVGMALASAGIAVAAGALWVLVPVAAAVAIIDRGVIAREERFLERVFGEEYLRYTRRVRRWL